LELKTYKNMKLKSSSLTEEKWKKKDNFIRNWL
jgi:hypothetical protein